MMKLQNGKNKKRGLAVLFMAVLLGTAVLTGCGSGQQTTPIMTESTKEQITSDTTGNTETSTSSQPNEEQETKARIAAMTGPTAIGMVKLMQEAENGNTAFPYEFSIYGTADEVSTGLIQGKLDLAAVPCNLASVLYQKSKGEIQIAAINTLGVLYIVETGETIQSVEDLKGKTIYSTGQGTTPEYTLNYLLTSYGLNPETDVTIEYKSEAAEVAAILAEAEDAVAMLPQPYVTVAMTQNDKLRIALSVTEEWEAVNSDSTVVTGVLVVRKSFAEQNPELIEDFLKEYEASAQYANENTDSCAELVEKYEIFKAAIAKKAIPYCNITFLSGDEMKQNIMGYLTTLYQQNPAAVGGALPDEEIFYQVKEEGKE